MNKAYQENVNAMVREHYMQAMSEYREQHSTYKRLRSCTAEVCETENYYVLRSYNTIVAVITKEHGQLYDALRMVYGFTSTSAQHITKFYHDYGFAPQKYTYRDI